jgi:hypothetical protein
MKSKKKAQPNTDVERPADQLAAATTADGPQEGTEKMVLFTCPDCGTTELVSRELPQEDIPEEIRRWTGTLRRH